jgi:hypothetical protein
MAVLLAIVASGLSSQDHANPARQISLDDGLNAGFEVKLTTMKLLESENASV